jgi:hypothetical protein
LLPYISTGTVNRELGPQALNSDGSLFLIPSQAADAMRTGLGLHTPTLLVALAHFVKRFAITPISSFNVGAVGMNKDAECLLFNCQVCARAVTFC